VQGRDGPVQEQGSPEDFTKLEDVAIMTELFHCRDCGGSCARPRGPIGGGARRTAYQVGETRTLGRWNHFLYSSFILPLCCNR